FDALRAAFEQFVENIPFYGFAVLCVDHPEVQALIGRVSDRRIITYGYSPQADFRAVDIDSSPSGMRFDVVVADRAAGSERVVKDFALPMLGRHNVLNALAAVALAGEMGIDEDVVRRALAGFEGVKRRFTRVGEAGGITVIDDYGHHPVEIAAVLDAARGVYGGRIIAVVQPHRYSRLRDLFEEFCGCFNDADMVVVADVFAAGEARIDGIDRDSLADGLRARGHRHVETLDGPESLTAMIAGLAEPKDVVICLGAGTITAWAHALPGELEALLATRKQGAGK
ncbi:MAG: cyanophycin synthetase, partial [Alphaproteobacteria bacterium]